MWFLNKLSLGKGPDSSEGDVGSGGESAQRCKARLERHQRTVERVVSSVQIVIYPQNLTAETTFHSVFPFHFRQKLLQRRIFVTFSHRENRKREM